MATTKKATKAASTKRPASKMRRAPKKNGGVFSQRKKLFVSIGAALVVVLVGGYVLASRAAATEVAFIGKGRKCLDNNAQKKVNGNKIQLWTCNSSNAQRWKVNSNSTITNANGYCLDVKAASKTRGTVVQLYQCNGTVAQKWKVNSSNKTIVNPNSGLCLDAKGGATADGTQIQTWTCNGGDAQKWVSSEFVAPPTTPPPTTTPPAAGTRKHFIMNAGPSDVAKAQQLGYNVIDATPDDLGAINSLPAGVQAMVWMGGAQCESFSTAFTNFKNFVNAQRNNPKIFGYFLYDEPRSRTCNQYVDKAGSDDDVKGRADFIHCLSNDPSKVNAAGECLENGAVVGRKTDKKSFIVDEYDYDYARVSYAKTHVDIFGIDPYPCRPSGCVYSGGSDQFRERLTKAKQYYSATNVAPVYQAFGGDGWKMPTAGEMNTMLAEYDKEYPSVILDVTYTYRRNTSGQTGALIDSSALQQALKTHNDKY